MRAVKTRCAGLCLAGQLRPFAILSATALLVSFAATMAVAYPIGPELPDDGFSSYGLPDPPPLASQWVESYPSDLTGQLHPMDPTDAASDPFANPSELNGGNPADGNWLVPYDGSTTHEMYSGDPLNTGTGIHVGVDLGKVDDAAWATENPLSHYFADSSGSPLLQLPALGFAPVPAVAPGGPFHYVVVYLTTTIQSATAAVNQWLEFPYTVGQVPDLKLTAGNNPVEFSFDAKFFLSDTQIPLDDLNNIYEPPTGSNFKPLPGLPEGTVIQAGGNITVPLPEPGSLSLVAIAGAFAAMATGYRRWRKAS